MTMTDNIVVGFIGLGTMGGKMATNILKAGYKVVVHDLHRQSAGHHLQAGAEWADTPRLLAERGIVKVLVALGCESTSLLQRAGAIDDFVYLDD